MAIVGGKLENKKIGLPIGVSGTHDKTQIDATTGFLTLKKIGVDGSNKPIYSDEGTWISDVVDLKDKFADFGKIFTTESIKSNTDNSSIAILTRVSDDDITWSNWVAVAYDGAIQSPKKRYIQIKINFFAGFETDIYLISDFDKVDDAKLFDSEFVDTSNGFRLKRNYEYNMTVDSSWTGEGSLHRKPIKREDWIRIDKLEVVSP